MNTNEHVLGQAIDAKNSEANLEENVLPYFTMAPSTSPVEQARGGGHQFGEIVSTCNNINLVHEKQTDEAVSTQRSEGRQTSENHEMHYR